MAFKAISQLMELNTTKDKVRHRKLLSPQIDSSCSVNYFNGAQNRDICGDGMALNIKLNHYVRINMGVGSGSNTKA